jgi:hypothetical protein
MNFNICIALILILTSSSAFSNDRNLKTPPPVDRIRPSATKKPEPLRPVVVPDDIDVSSGPTQYRRAGAPDPRSQYTVLMTSGEPAVRAPRPQMTFCQYLNDLFDNKRQFRALNNIVDLAPTNNSNLASGYSALFGITELSTSQGNPALDPTIFFNANTGGFHVVGTSNPGARQVPLHPYNDPARTEITDISTFLGAENFFAVARGSRGIICNRFGVFKL